MNINIAGYVIRSDDVCYMVCEEGVYQTGKRKGKKYFDVKTYHSTFESAVSSILEKKIRQSEANSLKELKEDVSKIKALIKKELEVLS